MTEIVSLTIVCRDNKALLLQFFFEMQFYAYSNNTLPLPAKLC